MTTINDVIITLHKELRDIARAMDHAMECPATNDQWVIAMDHGGQLSWMHEYTCKAFNFSATSATTTRFTESAGLEKLARAQELLPGQKIVMMKAIDALRHEYNAMQGAIKSLQGNA